MPTETSSQPTRVLIPEARVHQRRRYWRTGLAIVFGVLALAGLVAFLVALTAGATPGTGSHRAPRFAAGADGRTVLVRPVLCQAPPFSASAAATPAPEVCTRPYAETPASLDVQPVKGGYTWTTRSPDPALATYPTSARDVASARVLLNTTTHGTSSGARLLLGPSVMTLSRSTVTGATAHQTSARVWEVEVRLDSSASVRWDAVAYQFFHGQLAIDFGGRVVSTPLIEPTTASFTSFDGRLIISGAISHDEANALVAALTSKGSE